MLSSIVCSCIIAYQRVFCWIITASSTLKFRKHWKREIQSSWKCPQVVTYWWPILLNSRTGWCKTTWYAVVLIIKMIGTSFYRLLSLLTTQQCLKTQECFWFRWIWGGSLVQCLTSSVKKIFNAERKRFQWDLEAPCRQCISFLHPGQGQIGCGLFSQLYSIFTNG